MKLGKNSIIYKTDGYKLSHYKQLRKNTTSIYSYIEARSDKKYSETLFFGIQGFIKEFLEGAVVFEEDILEAECFFKAYGTPFNKDGWLRIAKEFDGKLPVKIKAVPEGSVIPNHNILVSIESTDPETCWLTSYLETALLRGVWFSSSVATLSYHIKKDIWNALQKSSDNPELSVDTSFVDFGARGTSSGSSAAAGGAGMLTCFKASDTIEAAIYAQENYDYQLDYLSLPASEHSCICAWTRDGEKDFYRHMMKQFCVENGIFACVLDSYDLFSAVEFWATEFAEELKNKKCLALLRPDSGRPSEVVLRCLQILDEKVGTTLNSKGYKILPPYFKIIQGDGINRESINKILEVIMSAGYSAQNVVFGCGGQLLQAPMRDDLGWAMKCSEVVVNGETIDVFKDPITDPGKRSKAGRLALIKENGEYKTVKGPHKDDILQTIFENGKACNTTTFAEIRERAWGKK